MTDEREQTLFETLQSATEPIAGQAARIAEIGDRRIAELRAQLEEAEKRNENTVKNLQSYADRLDANDRQFEAIANKLSAAPSFADVATAIDKLKAKLERRTAESAPLVHSQHNGGPGQCDACDKQRSATPERLRSQPGPEPSDEEVKRACPDCGSLDVDDKGLCNGCFTYVPGAEPRQERSAEAINTPRDLLGWLYRCQTPKSEQGDGTWSDGVQELFDAIVTAIERLQSDVAGKLTVTEEMRAAAKRELTDVAAYKAECKAEGVEPTSGLLSESLARAVGERK